MIMLVTSAPQQGPQDASGSSEEKSAADDHGSDGDIRSEPLEDLGRLLQHTASVQDQATHQLLSQEDVGHHVMLVHERQILVDGRDPQGHGTARVVKGHRVAIHLDCPHVWLVGTGDNLDRGY